MAKKYAKDYAYSEVMDSFSASRSAKWNSDYIINNIWKSTAESEEYGTIEADRVLATIKRDLRG